VSDAAAHAETIRAGIGYAYDWIEEYGGKEQASANRAEYEAALDALVAPAERAEFFRTDRDLTVELLDSALARAAEWQNQAERFAARIVELGERAAALEAERDKAMAAIQGWRENYQRNDQEKYDALDTAFKAGERAATLEAERDEIESGLPETFFCGSPLADRVAKISASWNHAIVVNRELEERAAKLEVALTHIAGAPYGWQWAIAVARAALAKEDTDE
jgi:chromosome segregation ATPase